MGDVQKVYYPSANSGVPFEVKLNLSKRAHEYRQDVYTIVDWLIDMGGFSKAMFYTGMGIAMVSALRLY